MELTNLRHVTPAVRDARVKVDTSVFRRRAAKLDYAKARQRWWIQVRFNSEIDLVILERVVRDSEIRLVELHDTFYLEDPRIPDTAEMEEAYRLAENVFAQVNGAAQVLCHHFHLARFESMVELSENGTGRGIVSMTCLVHGSSDFPAIRAFLEGDANLFNTMLPTWKGDKDVQDAFFYIGAEGNVWANLYKVCEIVQERAGGEAEVFKNGWCSGSAWERFRRTANHQEAIGLFSRHARSKAVPPPNPMTDSEARSFTAGLVKGWIQSLIS